MKNAEKDRDSKGKFTEGNVAAVGHTNPNARRATEISAAMRSVMSPAKAKKLMKKLIELGEAGNVVAIREAFDRVLGRPVTVESEPESNTPKAVRYSVEPPTESGPQPAASPGTSKLILGQEPLLGVD